MRAWQVVDGFGVHNLRLREVAEPEPGPGEVRVRVRAVSLNYRDLLMVQGLYNPRQPLPLVPGSDAVGVVDAVGDGVTGVKPGERVCPTFFTTWAAGPPTPERVRRPLGGPLDGTFRDALVVPADAVVPAPAHLSDEEAATLPCAALTAWSALVTQGGLTAGDTVLVLGTGGVSIFALQLARALGARVIVTSKSDGKLERALALGAEHGVSYAREPEWGRVVKALAGGDGVDHVIEVGGAGTLAQSLKAVRIGGQVSLIGVLAGAAGPVPMTAILMANVRVQGVLVGSRDGFLAMNRAISATRLRPVVDRVFPMEALPEAFAHLAAGRHFGKVVVRVGA